MPIRVSVPLPGIFRWEPRSGHRTRFNTLWYWLLGVWAVEATFWILIGVTAAGVWVYRKIRDPYP